MSVLMWLFTVPLIASVVVLCLPFIPAKGLRRFALILSLIPLALLLYNHATLVGMSANYTWIPPLAIHFFLQVDSISLLFLYLTAIMIPISILAIGETPISSAHVFYSFILMLQGMLIGFFMARDLALFTIFWESMLLPLYFIINMWGGEQRRYAALKFLIYMIAGSALMVAAVLLLYMGSAQAGSATFDMNQLQHIATAVPYAGWIFAIFMLAFSVKTPLFPFHAWLPDAYCRAPLAGTILLSALLSKAGIYGIIRVGMELFPQRLQEWSPSLLVLAMIGVFYGGLAAWRQYDFKRLIAYSSFSHVNFILAGLFIWHQPAQSGAILQALNHSVTITGLFLVAGWLEGRLHSTSMHRVGGLAAYWPALCWLSLCFVLSSVALPGTNNFIGELMILFGLFGQSPWLAAVLGLSVILSVIYMLRYMQKIYFGSPVNAQHPWQDIGVKELLVAAPLIALILWIGLYPAPVLDQIRNFNPFNATGSREITENLTPYKSIENDTLTRANTEFHP